MFNYSFTQVLSATFIRTLSAVFKMLCDLCVVKMGKVLVNIIDKTTIISNAILLHQLAAVCEYNFYIASCRYQQPLTYSSTYQPTTILASSTCTKNKEM
jgi:hypothetical protein